MVMVVWINLKPSILPGIYYTLWDAFKQPFPIFKFGKHYFATYASYLEKSDSHLQCESWGKKLGHDLEEDKTEHTLILPSSVIP